MTRLCAFTFLSNVNSLPHFCGKNWHEVGKVICLPYSFEIPYMPIVVRMGQFNTLRIYSLPYHDLLKVVHSSLKLHRQSPSRTIASYQSRQWSRRHRSHRHHSPLTGLRATMAPINGELVGSFPPQGSSCRAPHSSPQLGIQRAGLYPLGHLPAVF